MYLFFNGAYMDNDTEYEYAGFFVRLLANIVDFILLFIVFFALGFGVAVMGFDNIFNPDSSSYTIVEIILNIIGIALYIFLWVKFAGTPGKRLFKLKVLDDQTGDNITVIQAIIRYFSMILSTIVIFLGFIWIFFDAKKQGWHDKLAKTVVVREI